MSMTASQWQDRGDSAAREDLRAGHTGEWDLDAVLTHLGIAREDDTDAVAYGLAGDDLATAQRVALAGYARRRGEGSEPQSGSRFAVAWTEGGEARSLDVEGDEAAADATKRSFWEAARSDPSVDAHSIRVVCLPTASTLASAAEILRARMPESTARAEAELGAGLEELLARDEFRAFDMSARRQSNADGDAWHVARSPRGIDHLEETYLAIVARVGSPVVVVQ